MASDNRLLGEFDLSGILPAPRGLPKVEVKFDIDANGILNVTARDQATGKEQKITITGSSGLTEAEVQRMVKEAEDHAEDDRQRREAITLKNEAESRVFEAEKILAEHGDKITSELKAELDTKIQAVKEVLEKDPENHERLRAAYEEMSESLTKVGTQMYEAAAQQGGGADFGANGAEEEQAPTDDESTVEGEFREVGSDR